MSEGRGAEKSASTNTNGKIGAREGEKPQNECEEVVFLFHLQLVIFTFQFTFLLYFHFKTKRESIKDECLYHHVWNFAKKERGETVGEGTRESGSESGGDSFVVLVLAFFLVLLCVFFLLISFTHFPFSQLWVLYFATKNTKSFHRFWLVIKSKNRELIGSNGGPGRSRNSPFHLQAENPSLPDVVAVEWDSRWDFVCRSPWLCRILTAVRVASQGRVSSAPPSVAATLDQLVW